MPIIIDEKFPDGDSTDNATQREIFLGKVFGHQWAKVLLSIEMQKRISRIMEKLMLLWWKSPHLTLWQLLESVGFYDGAEDEWLESNFAGWTQEP